VDRLLAPGYPQYADVEAKLATLPVITVPTVTLDGEANAIIPALRWPVFRSQVLRQTYPPSGAECGPRPTAASAEGLRRRSHGSDETSLMGPNREVSDTGAAGPFDRGEHHAAWEQPQLLLLNCAQHSSRFADSGANRKETGSSHQQ
jgi:hypothetical protein